jgi:hypothetical protein
MVVNGLIPGAGAEPLSDVIPALLTPLASGANDDWLSSSAKLCGPAIPGPPILPHDLERMHDRD